MPKYISVNGHIANVSYKIVGDAKRYLVMRQEEHDSCTISDSFAYFDTKAEALEHIKKMMENNNDN